MDWIEEDAVISASLSHIDGKAMQTFHTTGGSLWVLVSCAIVDANKYVIN